MKDIEFRGRKDKMQKMMGRLLALLLPAALLLWGCTTPAGKKESAMSPTKQNADAETQLRMALEYDKKGQFEEAVVCYRKAAEQGMSMAQNNLGVMYKDGQGVRQDYREAVRWFRLAACQGNVLAQSNLGWMYQRGRGVAQDYDSARYWYM